jgi:cytoskeletal protein RodZ
MKRNLLVLMIVTLLSLAVITACSPKAKTPTAAPANSTAPTAYPAKQEPTTQTAATAYPATAPTTAPAPTIAPATVSTILTDAQVLALIEKQLNGHHPMDFLLSQRFTSDQWVQVLNQQQHTDVLFTPGELEQVVAYLIAHQK